VLRLGTHGPPRRSRPHQWRRRRPPHRHRFRPRARGLPSRSTSTASTPATRETSSVSRVALTAPFDAP
jgi:hypothetical protein